ncbi:saccharopine dehydrogenase family protein [Rhodohalobacter halophilus]|uniref:saccharopine dehydrogenase family protein n=1 Tax=Rhodohalobacter halophilus TaxID=1812810 RepID=UPI00083F697D|nr:saccharopine dehydrogenase NADP-binding domain-containing protein [Rhodohalobacter halophilus]
MIQKILIIGGYGAVGSIIAESISQNYQWEIYIAGRNLSKAEKLAHRLNHKVIPLQIDLSDPSGHSILEDMDLVIMCVEQAGIEFVKQCIIRGIHYIDITATHQRIEEIETLDCIAKKNNVRVVLSVGLAPGITNLLAQYCTELLPDGKRINLFVLLGTGEKHGDAAYRWTFDNLHTTYKISNNGESSIVKSFTSPVTTQLLGKRTFYLFNFSDQHSLVKTTRVNKVRTRLAFDSKVLTWAIALFRKVGLTKVFQYRKIQNIIMILFKKALLGDDIYSVKAVIENDRGEKRECSLSGNGESKITAYVASMVALNMVDSAHHYGVSHLNEVISEIPNFLNELCNYDNSIKIKL